MSTISGRCLSSRMNMTGTSVSRFPLIPFDFDYFWVLSLNERTNEPLFCLSFILLSTASNPSFLPLASTRFASHHITRTANNHTHILHYCPSIPPVYPPSCLFKIMGSSDHSYGSSSRSSDSEMSNISSINHDVVTGTPSSSSTTPSPPVPVPGPVSAPLLLTYDEELDDDWTPIVQGTIHTFLFSKVKNQDAKLSTSYFYDPTSLSHTNPTKSIQRKHMIVL